MRIINAVRGERGRGITVYVDHAGETHAVVVRKGCGNVYGKVALYAAGDRFTVYPHRKAVCPRQHLPCVMPDGGVGRYELVQVFPIESGVAS